MGPRPQAWGHGGNGYDYDDDEGIPKYGNLNEYEIDVPRALPTCSVMPMMVLMHGVMVSFFVSGLEESNRVFRMFAICMA